MAISLTWSNEDAPRLLENILATASLKKVMYIYININSFSGQKNSLLSDKRYFRIGKKTFVTPNGLRQRGHVLSNLKSFRFHILGSLTAKRRLENFKFEALTTTRATSSTFILCLYKKNTRLKQAKVYLAYFVQRASLGITAIVAVLTS